MKKKGPSPGAPDSTKPSSTDGGNKVGLEFNETEFEVRLAGILKRAFPFLGPGSILHQRRFAVRLGHKQVEVDGISQAKTIGRLDILLVHQNRPLAVLELKRPGLALTDDDRQQGRSYACLLDPMAPLVIVSNGGDTRIFQAIDGKELTSTISEAASLQALLKTSARVAANDLQNAVEILMGPTSGAVRRIIGSLSALTIKELTGPWNNSLLPFPNGLSFPRKATLGIRACLDSGQRFVILTGAPLIGKSNVLRELCEAYAGSDDTVALFVEGGAARHGLFRLLADAFSREFSWNINVDEVRHWLMGMSHKAPFRFIIAVDDADADLMGAELDGIASKAFGSRLQMVLSCSIGAEHKFTDAPSGRQPSPIGRHASGLELDLLDDDEFTVALKALETLRIGFMLGADRSQEYRNPWILRTIAADVRDDPNYEDEKTSALIPSLPGLVLMDFASRRFQNQQDLRGRYVSFANALLEDIADPDVSLNTALVSSFVCRRGTLMLPGLERPPGTTRPCGLPQFRSYLFVWPTLILASVISGRSRTA